MTEFYDSSIEELMPSFFKNSPEVQAISYAIQMQIRKLCDSMKKAQVYVAIDSLEDDKLDLLALELGSQYYSEDMDIDTKREIIKNTLLWYMKAGTVSAVQELADVVLGNGSVIEWTELGTAAGTFSIGTEESLTEEAMEEIAKKIKKVKNAKSHLVGVTSIRNVENTMNMGTKIRSHTTIQISLAAAQ